MSFETLKGAALKASEKIKMHSKSACGIALLSAFSTSEAFAKSGGLSRATDAVQEIQDWMYTILGVICGCIAIYNVIMALLEKKQWSDVILTIAKVAGAGATIAIFTWSWGLFGK